MNERRQQQIAPDSIPSTQTSSFDIAAAWQKAIALHQRGRLSEAEPIYRQILRVASDHFDARHMLGVLKHQQGRNDEALTLIIAAVQQRPNDVAALTNCAAVLNALNRFAESLKFCDQAIASNPDHAEAFNNRGVALKGTGRFTEALASHDQAIAFKPDYAEAFNNRGITLHALKRPDEALASYDQAIALKPKYADALNNRGTALYELKRLDEALACFNQAIGLKPDHANAHWNRAQLRLLTGDFDRGWEEHEWRARSNAFVARKFPQPLWLGDDRIDGKTILLHSEQGFGDTIHFCRYASLVAERGARVILEVQKPLQTLMAGLAGVSQVVAKAAPLPEFDLHCPLLSLPRAFRTRLATIPAATPYLDVPTAALNAWQTRLGPRSRPRIGLAWSGNAGHKRDQDRSISLQMLLPLLDIDAAFVSLQKEVRPADAAVLAQRSDILDVSAALDSFVDTAALIAQLDLVVAVDTSVAHLAGALNRQVWVMVSYVPDWRWLLDRTDSPWYPSARLFRQDAARRWDTVIAAVCEAARKFVEAGQNRGPIAHEP